MSESNEQPKPLCEPQIEASDCEICMGLGERETSLTKAGHEEAARPLPPEAARLRPAAPETGLSPDQGEYRICPLCGTFYFYQTRSEFLWGGSEEEEELKRLTPDQVRPLLTDSEYQARLDQMHANLGHPRETARRYASRCVILQLLQGGQVTEVRWYLAHEDTAIAAGGLELLRELMQANERNRTPEILGLPPTASTRIPLAPLLELSGLLAELGKSPREVVANPARYVFTWLGKYDQRLQKARAASEEEQKRLQDSQRQQASKGKKQRGPTRQKRRLLRDGGLDRGVARP